MSDTRERFLCAIAERLPPERVSELHLFPPLRQGGIESGVAVVAAELDAAHRDGAVDGHEADAANASADAGAPEQPQESFADREVALRTEADDGRAGADAERTGPAEEEYAPEPARTTAGAEDGDPQLTLGDALGAPACDPTDAAAGPPPAPPRPRRHTVYTARYRHTLKGPDRGKWEFDLVAEADAPLVTVETVVRGVQKRIGEMADPERLTPDELRAALDDTPWRATTG